MYPGHHGTEWSRALAGHPLTEVGSVIPTRMNSGAHADLWRSVRGLPDFWRLLQLRMASQFGDGLFGAGMAGALLFNPDRAADPMAIARAFTVLFLPYSLLGPFAGALMDRWDRRWVIVGATAARLGLIAAIGTILALRGGDLPLLLAALLANGMSRFVASGLSASLPHVVPREQVVTMNSVANVVGASAAFLGANFMLVPRLIMGASDKGASAVIFLTAIPVSLALVLASRFSPRALGPDDTGPAIHGPVGYAVVTGWLHGLRTVAQHPSVTATLAGLAAHRMVVGINSLVMLLLVHHLTRPVAGGMGTALLFAAVAGLGAFLSNAVTPSLIRRWGRYATANGALAATAAAQLPNATLKIPVMLACSFLLGVAGHVVKLCADSAMQLDVADALRGHVFAVQDALFWVSFIVAIALAAMVVPDDGRDPALVVFGSVIYLAGLAAHSIIGRRGAGADGR